MAEPAEVHELSARDLAVVAARAADDKQGSVTLVMDVAAVLEIIGWFVITSGRNRRQVRTITEAVEEQVALAGGGKPLRVEGLESAEWVLLDYGDVVVHVFDTDARAFYELERLYRDVPLVAWQDE